MLSPVDGATLSSSPVTFTWQLAPLGVKKIQLRVGNKPGNKKYFKGNFTPTDTSASVSIPLTGSPVYVRLRTRYKTGWIDQDYVYQTTNGVTP